MASGRALFAIQSLISAATLAFGMVMLARGGDPGIYLPVITSISMAWMPSPMSSSGSHRPADGKVLLPDIERPLLEP